jgi:hypothetical protein
MAVTDKVTHTLGAPLRRFFDRRFGSVNASLRSVSDATREALERDLHESIDPMSRRLDELSGELAAVGRSQVEAMSYVATALRALEDRVEALAASLPPGPAAGPDVVAAPYAIRALDALDAGERVLAIGFERSQTPLSLAALGLRVTAIGPVPYAFEHPNLEVLVGEPEDLKARFAAVVWAPHARDPRLERSAALLDAGGVVVVAADPDEPATADGFETLDRTGAGKDAAGAWAAGGDASLVLVTARRA